MQKVNPIIERFKKRSFEIDLALLLFILTAVNVKLYLKLLGTVAYFLYAFLYKKYRKTFEVSGFFKFYLLIPIAGIIGSIANNAFQADNYFRVFLFGCLQWCCAALICYLLQLTIHNISNRVLNRTIKAFFIVNAAASIIQLLRIVLSIDHFPYWFTDDAGLYGVSTGDYILGIFQSSSVTNASVCTLGAIYFLYNRDMKFAILCMIISAMATSNAVFLIFVLATIVILFFSRQRKTRINAILLFIVTLCLYIVISPNNIEYIKNVASNKVNNASNAPVTVQKQDVPAQTTSEVNIVKPEVDITPVKPDTIAQISKPNAVKGILDDCYLDLANTLGKLKRIKGDGNVSVINERATVDFFNSCYGKPLEKTAIYNCRYPLKLLSLLEMRDFLFSNWRNALFGSGIANFSSKLAIKATGLNIEGHYPERYTYASKAFLENHLYLLLYVYTLPPSQHSTINMPHTIYNQIGGEYGILGAILLLVFYFGYATKNFKNGPLCIFLTFTLALLFGLDYWFERMSVTILFELFIMKDIINGRVKEAD